MIYALWTLKKPVDRVNWVKMMETLTGFEGIDFREQENDSSTLHESKNAYCCIKQCER